MVGLQREEVSGRGASRRDGKMSRCQGPSGRRRAEREVAAFVGMHGVSLLGDENVLELNSVTVAWPTEFDPFKQ